MYVGLRGLGLKRLGNRYSVATPFSLPSPCAHAQSQHTIVIQLSRPIAVSVTLPSRSHTHVRPPERSTIGRVHKRHRCDMRSSTKITYHIRASCSSFLGTGSARVHRSSFILARKELLTIHLSHLHTVSNRDCRFMQLSCSCSMCHSTGSRWSQDDDDYKTSSSCPGCD